MLRCGENSSGRIYLLDFASCLNNFPQIIKWSIEESKLYPSLPVATAPEAEIIIVEGSAQSYRLVKIN